MSVDFTKLFGGSGAILGPILATNFFESRTWTAPQDGIVIVRGMGAGGAGRRRRAGGRLPDHLGRRQARPSRLAGAPGPAGLGRHRHGDRGASGRHRRRRPWFAGPLPGFAGPLPGLAVWRMVGSDGAPALQWVRIGLGLAAAGLLMALVLRAWRIPSLRPLGVAVATA